MWYRIADRWGPLWEKKSLCPNDIGLWVTSVSRAQIHKFWISCWWIEFAFEEQTRSIARGLNAAQGRVPAPNAKLIGSVRAHGTHLYVCRARNVWDGTFHIKSQLSLVRRCARLNGDEDSREQSRQLFCALALKNAVEKMRSCPSDWKNKQQNLQG